MPNVRRSSQVPRKGARTEKDISKTVSKALPRDDLAGTFAGAHNKGPKGTVKKPRISDTHVGSRR